METLPLDDKSLEVIVVDNASSADEATVIEQRFPQIKVIRSNKNLGFAGGNNLGIKAAHGKYLFFVNNDTLFTGKWENESSKDLLRLESFVQKSDSHGTMHPSNMLDTPHSHGLPCATSLSDVVSRIKDSTTRPTPPHTPTGQP